MKIYKHLYQIVITSLTFSNTAWLQILRRNYVILTLLLALNFIAAAPTMAANLSNDLLKQPATEITISLGNSANELKFEPNHLEFEAGKRYQLRLTNPSQQKHYFTAKDFADGIWTQKVQAGKVEIKGAIHELELKPGAEAEWVFVPLKSGAYSLRCPIPGHTEAGMIGEITIRN
ncbi:cupredoxin domain-containing protein [Nostoc sp. UHCC 0252]|uniref:cupredoxin domain-containing protein n=1 Tax=Nostoc sp. UHCC 0252 TaxID=3110241 RepID=UPI002B1FB67F|nr:cupredoxin domain-containing protein [Nostoc sp. UHCC 0252]MEA5602622.1 cupredoxin domain-containing protein [Nostoc sp. UHCC 0252]